MYNMNLLIADIAAGTARFMMFRAAFSNTCDDSTIQELEAKAWCSYGGDMNAALALFNALLPGWAMRVWACDEDDADAEVYPPMVVGKEYQGRTEGVDIFKAEVSGNNPARALLLASLRAYVKG
jgi:hypothetical protein